MAEMSASAILGLKLDSIPFSAFHVAVILVLVLVGFIDGYDLALTGSLLVLAKGPLHITPDQIRWLTIAATLFVVVGGFIASAISDHVSRKVIIQIGVVGITVRLEAAGFLVVVAIRRAFGLFPFRQYWCGTNFGVGREPKIAVPRRHRRAKTDAIDGERLLRTLMAWQRGEPLVCAMTVPLGSAAGT